MMQLCTMSSFIVKRPLPVHTEITNHNPTKVNAPPQVPRHQPCQTAGFVVHWQLTNNQWANDQ